jgi:hypothetical protein
MSRKRSASPGGVPPGFVPLAPPPARPPVQTSPPPPDLSDPPFVLTAPEPTPIKARPIAEEAKNLAESLTDSRIPGPDFGSQALRIFSDPRITGIGRTTFDARNSWWVQQSSDKSVASYYGASIESAYNAFVMERGLP